MQRKKEGLLSRFKNDVLLNRPVERVDPAVAAARQREARRAEQERQAIRAEQERQAIRAEQEQQAIRAEQERKAIRAEQERRRVELKREKENAKQQLREKQMQEKRQNASAENINHLRGLMRERYRLDVWIWNHRDTPEANRPFIFEVCIKADEVLNQICSIVKQWDPSDFGGQESEEWRMADAIKATVLDHGQRVMWTQMPPWELNDDEGDEEW